MIQSLRDSQQLVSQGNEVDDITIHIQGTFDPTTDSIVVSMQPFADGTGKCNKVSRAESQLFLAQINGKGLVWHGIVFRCWSPIPREAVPQGIGRSVSLVVASVGRRL